MPLNYESKKDNIYYKLNDRRFHEILYMGASRGASLLPVKVIFVLIPSVQNIFTEILTV